MKTFVQKLFTLAGFLVVATAAFAQEYSLDTVRIGLGGGTSTDGDFSVSGVIQPPPLATSSVGDYIIVGEFLSVTVPLSEAVSEPPPVVETLYVANGSDKTITKFTTNGVSSLLVSTGPSIPYGLAFDSAGNLHATNSSAPLELPKRFPNFLCNPSLRFPR